MMSPTAAALDPYDPGFTPVEVNLSANENGFGLPSEADDAIRAALARVATNRYPDPLASDVRCALARWHGVEPSQVSVGNGGDELIFNLLLAFGGPGRVLVDCPPTFSVYRLYAELLGTTVMDVPREPGSFAPDRAALLAAARSAHVVILCTPNNPTGTSCDPGLIADVAAACPGVVLADEAYGEFSSVPSAARLLAAHPNLAILHTLSKAFAFAGARLGYVLASTAVSGALAAVRQPYSVNVLTQAAAVALIEHRDAFAATTAAIVAGRHALTSALTGLAGRGVAVHQSDANFVLVRVPETHRVWQRLRDEHSVLVRDVSRVPGLEGCLRVTVGTPEENDRLVRGLAAILG